MLNMAMQNAGRRNGFEDITAEFSEFRDFKLKWTRSYKWISFEVSDYLRNAPENVIESLADTVFARIRGDGKSAYTQDVCDYLGSEGFLKENQKIYLKRFRGISETPQGKALDLAEVYDELVRRGLADRDENLILRWSTSGRNDRRVGSSSVIMKTIVMNSRLDTEGLSEDTIRYALYTQTCRVGLGFGPDRESLSEEYERLLSEFPGRDKAEAELSRLGMNL